MHIGCAYFLSVDVEKEDISENKDELAKTSFTRISFRNDNIRNYKLCHLLGDQKRCLGAKEKKTHQKRKSFSRIYRDPHIRSYYDPACA
jgi:hypothetical protein